MAKIYGALEVAQLEWFTQSPDTRPSAASNTYRVIYASDVKQVQISDGTNWIAFINGSTNQTLAGDITFSGQQIFDGLHRLSVTTDSSSTGAITALNNTTPVIEFTAAVTSISGIANSASGATVMLVNRTNGTIAVLDEDAGATAANRIRTGTGTQISLANNASILLTYVGDSRWHIIGGSASGSGSGSGGAGINYITNGSAEADTLGWAVYADAAGTSPVDGTGGSANVTITRSTTSPLIGTASFILNKDAANRQGQGWSYDFTIDSAYKAKVLQISFQYLVDSGTFVAGSSTTSSDVTVWIYDITNAVVIQPSSFKLLSNSTSISDTFNATFQTASNSTSYRLIFHVSTPSTSAYTLKVDGISVSPSTYVYGTPITDWQSYTPTITNGGTVSSVQFQWARSGQSVLIRGKFTQSGTTATEMRVSLPSGLTSADTSSIASIQLAGYMTRSTALAGSFTVLIEPSVTYMTFGLVDTTRAGLTKQGASSIGDVTVSLFATIPIQGWSSSVQTSDQTDTRVVAAAGNTLSSTSITANTALQFTNTTIDTHGAITTGVGYKFTAPVAGTYRVSAYATAVLASSGSFYAAKNGVFTQTAQNIITSYSTSQGAGGSVLVSLNTGDTIQIASGATVTANATLSNFSIERLTGPSAIAASETVAARMTSSVVVSGSSAIINFNNIDYDTHGMCTTGASARITVPISGKYRVSSLISFSAQANNDQRYLEIWKNGSTYFARLAGLPNIGTIAGYLSGSITLNLLAGEYIDIRYTNSGGFSKSTTGVAQENWVCLERVGN